MLRTRLLVAIAATSCMAATRPEERAGVITPAFSNTVVVTYPDGSSERLWLHPDGKWDGQSRHGNPRSGRWTMARTGAICLRQSQPPTFPLSYCTAFPRNLHVGVTWSANDVLGRPTQMTLAQGGWNDPSEGSAPRGIAGNPR
jgi:hypothetical protein